MDRQRTDQNVRRRKRWVIVAVIGAALLGVTAIVASLDPAVPVVTRSSVWIDTVKRGSMLRQVRGIGSLVPEEIAWVSARTDGRVDQIVLRPGATVMPEDVILVLTNPEVRQAAVDAQSQLNAAEAETVNLQTQLKSGLLAAQSAAISAQAQYEQSSLKAEVNERLFKKGLVSELDLRLSSVTAREAKSGHEIEQKRLVFARNSIAPQVAVKRAEVDRVRAQARLREEDLEALSVRAGMEGVLQLLQVEVGAQVTPGTNLARVANPNRLKAQVRVAETQAKDVRVGQRASIDTRGAVVEGTVARIDPSVQNGTVMVDVALEGELPPGARPDLTIEGTIEIERLSDVLFVGRPAFGNEQSAVEMFKLDPNGELANRIPVRLGRSSTNTVEIPEGLAAGDRVILSDMSQWAESARIRIK